MKIIIFYASYGGGHYSAAKAVEDYYKTNYQKLDIELIDCMKYINKTIEKVSTAAYRNMAKKAPWAWGKIYNDSQKGALAHISSRANTIMAIKLLKLLREKNPDIIISTHPFGSQMCSYLKRKEKIKSKLVTILTDFKSHDQWLVGSEYTDLFFVSNENMKKELLNKNIQPEKIFVTGVPISNKFSNNFNKNEIIKELNFSENKKNILFFGGGAYGLGKSVNIDILDCLLSKFNNINVIAISGKNEIMKNKFLEIAEKYNKKDSCIIMEYTDRVAEFMAISDLVITKPGGLTSSECIASGVPMLIINPIPGQEEENAEFLVEKKVAVWLKKSKDIYLTLNVLINDDNFLNNLKNNISNIYKSNSTENICEIILNEL